MEQWPRVEAVIVGLLVLGGMALARTRRSLKPGRCSNYCSAMSRTTIMIVMALIAVGCTPGPDGVPRSAPSDVSGLTASCGPVETLPLQGEGHLVGDQEPPVPYNSSPPASGWHTSGGELFGVADESRPLREPEQVAILEAGGIVITYNGLETSEVEPLATLVTKNFPGQAALTHYDGLEPGQMALTAWGRLQLCSPPDPAAASAFIEAYATAGAAGEGQP